MDQIAIESPLLSTTMLRSSIESVLHASGEDENAKLLGHAGQVRSFEASVIVSVVGVAGTLLGTLMTGLLKVLSDRQGQKIIVTTSDGVHVEVPGGTSPEKLAEYLATIRDATPSRIRLE